MENRCTWINWFVHSALFNLRSDANIYGMKLCKQTIWPQRTRKFIFKTRFGKPFYMHLLLKIKVFPQNMGIGLDKKKHLGSAQKFENLSTLGHYCTVNKTIRNFLLVTISQSDNFSILGECPKFGNFQILTKK